MIDIVNPPFAMPLALVHEFDELNVLFARLARGRAILRLELAALRDDLTPPVSRQGSSEELMARMRVSKALELAARLRLHDYYLQLNAYRANVALDDALVSLERARGNVREQLREIGFVERSAGDRPSLTEFLVRSHPAVQAAIDEVATVRSFDVGPALELNRRAIERLSDQPNRPSHSTPIPVAA